jgi:hypothetical protein
MELLVVMLVLAAFSLVAWRWGYDSREEVTRVDWKGRRTVDGMSDYHHL